MQRAGMALPQDAQLERRRHVSQPPAQEAGPLQAIGNGTSRPAAQLSEQESGMDSEKSEESYGTAAGEGAEPGDAGR